MWAGAALPANQDPLPSIGFRNRNTSSRMVPFAARHEQLSGPRRARQAGSKRVWRRRKNGSVIDQRIAKACIESVPKGPVIGMARRKGSANPRFKRLCENTR